MKGTALLLAALALAAPAAGARGEESAPAHELEYMVPEMEGRSFGLTPGPRPYRQRLAFSPGFGRLGSEPYYLLRLAFNPTAHLGYEAQIGHNPAQSVHALVHSFSALLRWPLPGRLQPYLTAGYGMMLIFPGRVFQADPVTANQVSVGAGLEIYLREDVALRGEMRTNRLLNGQNARVAGRQDYGEFSVGLAFYRDFGR